LIVGAFRQVAACNLIQPLVGALRERVEARLCPPHGYEDNREERGAHPKHHGKWRDDSDQELDVHLKLDNVPTLLFDVCHERLEHSEHWEVWITFEYSAAPLTRVDKAPDRNAEENDCSQLSFNQEGQEEEDHRHGLFFDEHVIREASTRIINLQIASQQRASRRAHICNT